jgi:DNA-binding NarL/FixJ family response regulator
VPAPSVFIHATSTETSRSTLSTTGRQGSTLRRKRALSTRSATGPPGAPALPPALPDHLTPSETEVLALIGEALWDQEIGRRLFLAQATVKLV